MSESNEPVPPGGTLLPGPTPPYSPPAAPAPATGEQLTDGEPYRNPYEFRPDPLPYRTQPYGQPYALPYPTQPYGQPYALPRPTPPYGQPYAQPGNGPRRRRTSGYAIASLVLGAVSISISVAANVIPSLGTAALVVGVWTMVAGGAGILRAAVDGSRGMSIAGLVLGVVAIALAIAVMSATSRAADSADDARADPGGQNELPDVPADPGSEPDATGPLAVTTSGGIPVGADGVAGTTTGVGTDAVVVSVYTDYMCPACGLFEQVNGSTLDRLRQDGTIVVEYHPVSILDWASLDTGYSTRAAAAAALVAYSAPEAFVAFNTALLTNQPAENTAGLSDVEIAGLARASGVPDAVASTIESSAYLDGPDSFVGWVGEATAQAGQDLGELTTPTVLLDGVHMSAIRYDWTRPGRLEQAISDAHR